jgi:hypothetical protein
MGAPPQKCKVPTLSVVNMEISTCLARVRVDWILKNAAEYAVMFYIIEQLDEDETYQRYEATQSPFVTPLLKPGFYGFRVMGVNVAGPGPASEESLVCLENWRLSASQRELAEKASRARQTESATRFLRHQLACAERAMQQGNYTARRDSILDLSKALDQARNRAVGDALLLARVERILEDSNEEWRSYLVAKDATTYWRGLVATLIKATQNGADDFVNFINGLTSPTTTSASALAAVAANIVSSAAKPADSAAVVIDADFLTATARNTLSNAIVNIAEAISKSDPMDFRARVMKLLDVASSRRDLFTAYQCSRYQMLRSHIDKLPVKSAHVPIPPPAPLSSKAVESQGPSTASSAAADRSKPSSTSSTSSSPVVAAAAPKLSGMWRWVFEQSMSNPR